MFVAPEAAAKARDGNVAQDAQEALIKYIGKREEGREALVKVLCKREEGRGLGPPKGQQVHQQAPCTTACRVCLGVSPPLVTLVSVWP